MLHLVTGLDVIMDFDFTAGLDKLRVSNAEFGTTGASNIINTTDNVTPTFAGPQFIYERNAKVLYFDADGAASSSTDAGPVPIAWFPNADAGNDPVLASSFEFVA